MSCSGCNGNEDRPIFCSNGVQERGKSGLNLFLKTQAKLYQIMWLDEFCFDTEMEQTCYCVTNSYPDGGKSILHTENAARPLARRCMTKTGV